MVWRRREDRDARERELEELLQQMNPNVAVAEVSPRDLAPVPADPSGTRTLLNELLSYFDLRAPKEGEKIEAASAPLTKLKSEMIIRHDLANLIASSALNRQTVYVPALQGFSHQVWADYKLCSHELVEASRRTLDVLLHEIRELLKLYVQRGSDDKEVYERLKSKLELLFQHCSLALDLFPQILYRIMAVRSLDLPPPHRSSLANIQMLRIDFLVGRRSTVEVKVRR